MLLVSAAPFQVLIADPFEKPPLPETENLVWPLSEVTLSTLTSKVRRWLPPTRTATWIVFAWGGRHCSGSGVKPGRGLRVD